MLTGSAFYRSAAEQQAWLKRVSSKAAGKEGAAEEQMRRLLVSDVTGSHCVWTVSVLFWGIFCFSRRLFHKSFKLHVSDSDSSGEQHIRHGVRSLLLERPLRPAVLATRRESEREEGPTLVAARQREPDTDRWKDRHLVMQAETENGDRME